MADFDKQKSILTILTLTTLTKASLLTLADLTKAGRERMQIDGLLDEDS